MLIDCDTCVVKGPACSDCVVSVLLGPPNASMELDDAERCALAALAGAGMVPRLRLVPMDRPPRLTPTVPSPGRSLRAG